MKLEISEDEARTLVEVPDGVSTVGGAESDRVRVKGVPPKLVTVVVEAGTVVVEGRRPFVVDRLPCPAGRKRLLLPGETLHLGDRAWLRHPRDARLETPRSAETVAVARELLGALDAPTSRAGTLQCLTGLDLGRSYPLADGQTELGRGESAAIRVRDRHVSRRHARITVREGGLFIEDLGTANGVLVNGQRVIHPRALMDGDLIEVGATLMRYGGPAREPAPAPGPAAAPPAEAPSPQATTDELPSLSGSDPAGTGERPARRARLDGALLLAGVALALAGALVTWSFSRAAAPDPRDPPAAPSSAGAARRSS
ncbi:MAG TPA: FHA domain-containing protein [Myxococcaceae bacterium]|jgi:hypothetical protein